MAKNKTWPFLRNLLAFGTGLALLYSTAGCTGGCPSNHRYDPFVRDFALTVMRLGDKLIRSGNATYTFHTNRPTLLSSMIVEDLCNDETPDVLTLLGESGEGPFKLVDEGLDGKEIYFEKNNQEVEIEEENKRNFYYLLLNYRF